MSYNCQAALPVHEEISRLLVAAASHATASAACVDGPGQRVTANDILVCEAAPPDANTKAFVVAYEVVVHKEGDTRACSRTNTCDMGPRSSRHELKATFGKKKGRYVLDVPKAVPGIDGMTPLGKAHKGNCYGDSPAFQATPIQLKK